MVIYDSTDDWFQPQPVEDVDSYDSEDAVVVWCSEHESYSDQCVELDHHDEDRLW